MFSFSRTATRAAARASRSSLRTQSSRALSTLTTIHQHPQQAPRLTISQHGSTRLSGRRPTPQIRTFAGKSTADEVIEEIQEQYATARDEFEIASEETEKKSVYAADDRAAAREELDALKEMFQKAIDGEEGEEVKRRVGPRIRELDHAIIALEESALQE